jgi:hypothetical protein
MRPLNCFMPYLPLPSTHPTVALSVIGAELLPSEPPTPPTLRTPSSSPNTPDTPTTTAFSPMPCTPALSTLADMQSLFDAYFRSSAATAAGNNHVMPARASLTFSSAGPSHQMSREAPKPEQEPEQDVAVRNCFQCIHHHCLIKTACLGGVA